MKVIGSHGSNLWGFGGSISHMPGDWQWHKQPGRLSKSTQSTLGPQFGCLTKNRGILPPKSSILIGIFHYKPSILGKILWTNGWFGGKNTPIFGSTPLRVKVWTCMQKCKWWQWWGQWWSMHLGYFSPTCGCKYSWIECDFCSWNDMNDTNFWVPVHVASAMSCDISSLVLSR